VSTKTSCACGSVTLRPITLQQLHELGGAVMLLGQWAGRLAAKQEQEQQVAVLVMVVMVCSRTATLAPVSLLS
jgi:hypothetical protein